MSYLTALCIAGFIHEVHPPALIRPNEPIYIGWAFPTDDPCDEPSGISGKLEREPIKIDRAKKGSR